MKKKLLLFATLLLSVVANAQNSSCDDMGPICTDSGADFTAQSGIAGTDVGNDYGCLGSQPNPTWYYLEIAEDGTLDMTLSAPSDIDFIIWGPFTDLAEAVSYCGDLGVDPNAPEVDCSYSATNNETPSIANAVTGEVYIMLVTNYANSVQDVTLQQSGGTAATDCSIVEECVSNPGTFVRKKNGTTTALPLYLCEGDDFSVLSNDDYILPNDTVFDPVGDYTGLAGEITTAQLMWLVYDAVPVGNDPAADAGFLGNNFIIPSEDLSGANTGTDPLFQALGGNCGTYYFVPVAGDDGDANQFNTTIAGTGDNLGLHWDKNGNGCYELGTAIPVTFACPMEIVPAINCDIATQYNGMDLAISGGSGNYTIVNQGAGNLASTNVVNNGTAEISGLTNNQGWEIDVTDNAGCTANASGIFAAPAITNTTVNPASSCPVGTNGSVVVNIGTSGQAPYLVTMNNVATAGPSYTYSDQAGTAVTIVVADNNGCTLEEIETITSAGHFIDINVTAQTDEECFGDGQGSATITAVPTPTGNVTTVVWTSPTGVIDAGANNQMANTAMQPGNWTVTVTDDSGCDVTIPVTIGAPQELDIFVTVNEGLQCFELGDGDVTLDVNGGVFAGQATFIWETEDGLNPNVTSITTGTTNNLNAGILEVFVTDDNGCQDSVEFEVIQPAEITAHFTIKDVLCYGDPTGSIIIDSVTNNFGNVDYIWNLTPFPNPATTSNIASGLPVGSYQFKVKDEQDCENQYEVTISQNDSIYWDELGFEFAICRNQIPFDNGQGQVYAAAARGGSGIGGSNFDYVWTQDSNGATTTNTTWGNRNPGNYTIVATDEYGCTLTETIYLDSLSPIAAFNATSPQFTSDYVGTAIVNVEFENLSLNYAFSEDPNADTTFIWSFSIDGDTNIYTNSDINEIVKKDYTSEGLYTVCLTVIENLNGCEDSTCIDIQIFDQPSLTVPNVFTPGGGGVNDEFFFPNQAIVEFSCTVYDRWGKEVFQFNDISDIWDGSNSANSKECSDGVYFYIYEGTSSNGTEYKGQGNVHLIRTK